MVRMTKRKPPKGQLLVGAPNKQVNHANAYRGIIFGIVVYPIASALFNLTSVICVIHATQNDGVHNWTGYCVLLLSEFIYGGRSILYGLLAVTVPALVRAMHVFTQQGRGMNPSSISGVQRKMRSTESKGNISVHIELATVYQEDTGTVTELNGVPTNTLPELLTATLTTSRCASQYPISKMGQLMTSICKGVRTSPGNVPIHERSHIRFREDSARRQKEFSALNRERQEFQRQI
ncbi:hypothetical protein B0H13DRAFT_2375670 [Mycena leptocephala]|nr:hypothetical protein B0H13DRAFT_2375670 [Mycena leptocephala]